MNYRIDVNFYCHGCNQNLALCEVYLKNKCVYCLLCDTHLGYEWDLPSWVIEKLTKFD